MIRGQVRRNTTLLAFLRREGPLTTNEIASRFGWKMPYAFKELQALRDEGLLTAKIIYRREFGGGVVNTWEIQK